MQDIERGTVEESKSATEIIAVALSGVVLAILALAFLTTIFVGGSILLGTMVRAFRWAAGF